MGSLFQGYFDKFVLPMCQIRDRLQLSDVVPLLWLSFPSVPKAKVTPSPPVIDLNLQLFASLKGNLVKLKQGRLMVVKHGSLPLKLMKHRPCPVAPAGYSKDPQVAQCEAQSCKPCSC